MTTVSQWITSLVDHIVRQTMPPKSGGLWTALGTPLVRTETSGPMEYFHGDLDGGPFARAELRVNRATGLAEPSALGLEQPSSLGPGGGLSFRAAVRLARSQRHRVRGRATSGRSSRR